MPVCAARSLLGAQSRAWEFFPAKFPQGESIGWAHSLILALRIEKWAQWGIT